MSLIDFENVTLGYEGNPVIEGLSFSVNKGDYLCVMGQNGSGKSTMMKAMLGFLHPMSGRIVKSISKNGIGYLPQQQPGQADFPAGVREVVLSGRLGKRGPLPFYSRADREIAALFVSIGRQPATELFAGQVELDAHGYIVADESTKTSLPGVFVAGDVRTKELRQVVTAAADGAVAAHHAEQYIAMHQA